jgi:hypothetical protein
MLKIGSMSLLAGVLYMASAALAADEAKRQVIPDFAATDKTGWVLDHAFGVDDLLPAPTGGPDPQSILPSSPGITSVVRIWKCACDVPMF